MSNESSKAIYFISVASTLSGIHPQTIRTYEEKGLIKPYRTGGGTRRYSQEDIDKLIQIQNLSQRGINLDGIKIIYEMRDRISDLQMEIESLKEDIKLEKNQRIQSLFTDQAAINAANQFNDLAKLKECNVYEHINKVKYNFLLYAINTCCKYFRTIWEKL